MNSGSPPKAGALCLTGLPQKFFADNRYPTLHPKKLRLSGTLAGTFVSALSYLGREQVTSETIAKIKRHLPQHEFHTIMQQTEHMPCWIAGALHRYQLIH